MEVAPLSRVSPAVPRFGPPLVLREERGVSWEQLQQSILAQLRALLRGEVRAQVSWDGVCHCPLPGHAGPWAVSVVGRWCLHGWPLVELWVAMVSPWVAKAQA